MEDVRDLKELQIDALREVANIGAGHAATALSQMTNRRIMISVPQINIARLEEVADLLGDAQAVVVAVLMHMLGDLTGRTLLLFPEKVGQRLCDMLLRRPSGATSTSSRVALVAWPQAAAKLAPATSVVNNCRRGTGTSQVRWIRIMLAQTRSSSSRHGVRIVLPFVRAHAIARAVSACAVPGGFPPAATRLRQRLRRCDSVRGEVSPDATGHRALYSRGDLVDCFRQSGPHS